MSSAGAAPASKTLWKSCLKGTGAAQCGEARGEIAADPNTGHVYVVDRRNFRIDEFSAWGEFRLAWGWGVATGANEFQICGPKATPASTCQQGVTPGPVTEFGNGQFGEGKMGIAVDSSGAVYVYSSQGCTGGITCNLKEPNRVQKFDSEGNLILMFGRQVNQTEVELREEQEANSEPVTVTAQEEDLCTVASGDVCGPGTQSNVNGGFGSGPLSPIEAVGNFIDAGPGDTIYVGGQEHVQEFQADGTFVKIVTVPGEQIQSLAVDPSGNLYLSYLKDELQIARAKANVQKIGPTGTPLCTTTGLSDPLGLAFEAGGLYALNGPEGGSGKVEVRHFEPNCTEVAGSAFEPGLVNSFGIAANMVTEAGEVGLYVTNADYATAGAGTFVRAYYPPPDRPAPFDQPPLVPPSVTAQFASSVGSDSAEVKAQINPHFFEDTTYYVEYGTEECSKGGCLKAPATPVLLGAGRVDEAATSAPVTLPGLLPETPYFFRFVSESSGGGPVRGVGGKVGSDGSEGRFDTYPQEFLPPPCPANEAFRIGPSAKLPDCRAYEMVSPVDKNGGDIAIGAVTTVYGPLAESSADGGRATYSSLRAFAEPEAAPLINQYLSVRDPDGWVTHSIAPPRKDPPHFGPGISGQYKAFSEDLCSAWLDQESDFALVPGAPVGVASAYRRENCSSDPAYELLTPIAPPGFGPGKSNPENYIPDPQGFSLDYAHTVFRANGALTPNACKTAEIYQVYEYSKEGPLRLVSVLPPEGMSSKATCTHSSAGTFNLDQADGFRGASVYHAVSTDGERVFWTDTRSNALPGNGEGSGVLYLRLNSSQPPSKVVGSECTEPARACTLAVSEATKSQFRAANPEGTKALYSVGEELFEFDLATKSSTLIAKGLKGVIGASEDLARVYLVSSEKLSGEQANSAGDKAVAGKENVYLAEGGDFTFVARLAAEEGSGSTQNQRPLSPGSSRPFLRTSRVSPDGLHLAFNSAASLTGYDNTDQNSDKADSEVFLYDAEPGAGPGQLACVSCNPSGARPAGREVGALINAGAPTLWYASILPGWAEQLKPTRLLSADGNRLYFESFDALIPRDTNGMQDVYQWERAAGKAQCQAAGAGVYSAKAGGCISLISSGEDEEDSELIDASNGGKDVFFATEDSLVPQDPTLVDVYDAREGGGFAPLFEKVQCEAEACQPPPPSPPTTPAPQSTLPGPPNPKPKPPKCPKGKHRVTKNGKSHCVANKGKGSGKGKKSKTSANKSGRASR